MFVNIPSGQNSGSCRRLAEYLNKEEIQENRFFSASGENIHVEDVIQQTDCHNRQGVGKDESKFFLIDICPSNDELKHLIGRDVEDFSSLSDTEKAKLFSGLKAYTGGVMDGYALNFGREKIKGKEDLLYFAKIETDRTYKYDSEEVKSGLKHIGDKKEGLNVHVQVIVSRKSRDGKTKLSPAYGKSRGNDWHLKGRGRVRRGFDHEKFKIMAAQRFEKQFAYKMSDKEKYAQSRVDKDEALKTVRNNDLREILSGHKFTNYSHVEFLMREKGYQVKYYRGNFIFTQGMERFSISGKTLSKFTTPYVSNSDMKSICARFNGYKFEDFKEKYKDKNIRLEKVTFEKKDGKRFEYFVLHDRQTRCSIPLSRIRNYAYDNKINIFSKEHAVHIDHTVLRGCLSDPNVRTFRQFEKHMNDRGYKVEIDIDKGFRFSKGDEEFFCKGSAIRANLFGYGKHSSDDYKGNTYTQYSHCGGMENLVKGSVSGQVKGRAGEFIFKDEFAEERKIIHKGQQAFHAGMKIAKVVSNPSLAPLEMTKSLVRAAQKLSLKITR